MSILKRFSILLVLSMLVMSFGVTAAQGDGVYCTPEVRAELEGQGIYIPVISKGFQHEFWQAVQAGAEMAAADCGVEITFEGPESESMVDRQLEMLQTALDRNPSAIAFAALDSQAAIPLLERAQAEGIPVIGFDSGVDSDIPLATAATDNIVAAAYAADMMAELIGGSGQVAVIAHDQTSRTGIDRVDGFVNRMAEAYPDIEVVDVQYGGGDHLRSTDLARSIILAHPDLKGFFGANEGSAIGVLNAVTELGMEDQLVVIGYDSGQQQIEAIASGAMEGAITQNPIGIGYKAVEAAVMAIRGETIESEIDTGFEYYTADNYLDDNIAPLLYGLPEGALDSAESDIFCTPEVRAQLEGQGIYIPVISKGFQHQFWQAVQAGAEQAAADCGVEITFEGPESESMVDRQLEMLQTALDRNPSAIAFAALDSQAAIPLLERAQAEGIPVIGFDSGVDSDIPLATAATDNIAAAAYAADMMAELIGGSGQVAVIAHDQTSRTGIDRVDGFVNRMAEAYPDIEVVDVQYGGGDHLRSTDLARSIILAHPDLKGFFGANEGSAIGVLNAVTELGMEDQLVIIGYDSGQQQVQAVASGAMEGAITQNPIGIGYKAVEAAVMAILGVEVESEIDTGFEYYNSENYMDENIAALLYD